MFVNEIHGRCRTTIAELRFYEPWETHDDARNRFEGETVHPEGAYGHPPPSDAVRTRANDYHRGKPRADRRFTMDFTLSRRDTIHAKSPLLRRGTTADQPLWPPKTSSDVQPRVRFTQRPGCYLIPRFFVFTKETLQGNGTDEFNFLFFLCLFFPHF